MKIIELLNKIANNEEVPKKIKYSNTIYEFKDDVFGTGYLYEDKGLRYWFSEEVLSDSTEELNYEVEIIEDEEEIDIQSIEEVNHYNIVSAIKGKTEENIDNELKLNSLAINKLIKAVKQLDKKVNSIEQK
jgi:hypothetical protein